MPGKLPRGHDPNHSFCLSLLPPAGPGLCSCVHLPSSSRASCQRYWSPVFSRFLFPVLLRDQVPAVGSLGHHTETRVSSRGARGSPDSLASLGPRAWSLRARTRSVHTRRPGDQLVDRGRHWGYRVGGCASLGLPLLLAGSELQQGPHSPPKPSIARCSAALAFTCPPAPC